MLIISKESSCFREYWKDLLILPALLIKSRYLHTCLPQQKLLNSKITPVEFKLMFILAFFPVFFQGRKYNMLSCCCWRSGKNHLCGKSYLAWVQFGSSIREMCVGKNTHSACYGPYVHLIEFASFQAECQMDSLTSDKSDKVFSSCSLTSFRFIQNLRSLRIWEVICTFLGLILECVSQLINMLEKTNISDLLRNYDFNCNTEN